MSSSGAAASGAALLDTSARAQASRRNGARSRGPKTKDGKARSSQNALRHGLRAEKCVVLPDEDAAEYEAHEAALVGELAPEGALQTLLARRVAAAAWRLLRSDRIEAQLFEHQCYGGASLGLALVRDGYGARTFQTLLRYRGAAQAELWRSLRTLKALQAEAAEATAPVREAAPAPVLMLAPKPTRAGAASEADREAGRIEQREKPIEPKARANPGASGSIRPADEPPGQTRKRLMASASYSLARTLT